jgi:membrane dipeptidase
MDLSFPAHLIPWRLLAATALMAPLFLFAASTDDEGGGPESPALLDLENFHREALIVDLHSDALDRVYKAGNRPQVFETSRLQSGLPRLERGGIKVQFFAAWEQPEKKGSEADVLIGDFQRMLALNPDRIAFAGSGEDLHRNRDLGKISAFLTLEGGEAMGDDLGRLDYFYGRGVRLITLTWNRSNLLADAAKDPHQPHGGLSPLGRRVVERMNELGMIVDVSHASAAAARQAIAISRAPVMASHSNCYALKAHPRNLKDDLIREICGGGGVIGVCFHRTFLTRNKTATVADVAGHLDHLIQVGGLECAALGSDFDGGIITPAGLANAGELAHLTEELLRRGHGRQEIEMIYGLNALRFMDKVFGAGGE